MPDREIGLHSLPKGKGSSYGDQHGIDEGYGQFPPQMSFHNQSVPQAGDCDPSFYNCIGSGSAPLPIVPHDQDLPYYPPVSSDSNFMETPQRFTYSAMGDLLSLQPSVEYTQDVGAVSTSYNPNMYVPQPERMEARSNNVYGQSLPNFVYNQDTLLLEPSLTTALFLGVTGLNSSYLNNGSSLASNDTTSTVQSLYSHDNNDNFQFAQFHNSSSGAIPMQMDVANNSSPMPVAQNNINFGHANNHIQVPHHSEFDRAALPYRPNQTRGWSQPGREQTSTLDSGYSPEVQLHWMNTQKNASFDGLPTKNKRDDFGATSRRGMGSSSAISLNMNYQNAPSIGSGNQTPQRLQQQNFTKQIPTTLQQDRLQELENAQPMTEHNAKAAIKQRHIEKFAPITGFEATIRSVENTPFDVMGSVESIPIIKTPRDSIQAREEQAQKSKKQYKIVRGGLGGPSQMPNSLNKIVQYEPLQLNILYSSHQRVKKFPWSDVEIEQGRRIIRMYRQQKGTTIEVYFHVVNADVKLDPPFDNMEDVDEVEVSVIRSIETQKSKTNTRTEHFMTSVDFIEIIECLIGKRSQDNSERRRERGRIRLNLMRFWLKTPLPSKKSIAIGEHDSAVVELALKIRKYSVSKPPGFNKEVRIMPWDKLAPAMLRALEYYFAEVPLVDGHKEGIPSNN
ncbi:hypothetical protein PUMCH_002558 [Australozyma saopauloensis]|uniref:DUF7082 domain-containing protein n=1 Tax=Australozyma saopauloensis TaxID=291208 RepID=A0AAX4HAA3_9ASCO|nr:hypothetical protein PUMCH_002558 [[Candida] saopauloensis]